MVGREAGGGYVCTARRSRGSFASRAVWPLGDVDGQRLDSACEKSTKTNELCFLGRL